jgi:hypothetical protein
MIISAAFSFIILNPVELVEIVWGVIVLGDYFKIDTI